MNTPERSPNSSPIVLVIAFWLLVGVPLAWGVYRTLLQAAQLFG